MTRSLTIAGKTITDENEPYVIAELGSNHGGSLEECKRMIRAAATAGADAVKLQKRDNQSLYTKAYYDRPYTSENAYGATYGAHREALEMVPVQYWRAWQEADRAGVELFATAFDEASAAWLETEQTPAFKIASGDLTNTPFLKYVADFGRPMIVSTGAACEKDVDRAVDTIWPINQQLALLHCSAIYPTPPEVLNLRVITTYRDRYPDITIGLSSHYSGISDVIAAYVLGARIFEKHFTLDRAAKGTDHAFSLEPAGFAKMVSYLRKTRTMLGDGIKRVDDAERPALEKMGKSIYAAHPLPAGHVLTVDDLAIKSPGGHAFAPYWLDDLIGRELARPIGAEEPFALAHVGEKTRPPDAEPEQRATILFLAPGMSATGHFDTSGNATLDTWSGNATK